MTTAAIAARVLGSAYTCGKPLVHNRIVKLTGPRPTASSFTATGQDAAGGPGRCGYTLTGTLAPDTVDGDAEAGRKGCPKYTCA